MWKYSAGLILRNRIFILISLLAVTAFMLTQSQGVKMSYKFGGLLPKTDPTFVSYLKFLDEFSEDGNVVVLGIDDPQIEQVEGFNAWYDLGENISEIEVPLVDTLTPNGQPVLQNIVDSVFSIARVYDLKRKEDPKRFEMQRVFEQKPSTQEELDSLLSKVKSLPFYEDFLYQKEAYTSLMMVVVNAQIFNSENRGDAILQMDEKIAAFEEATGIKVHRSGLPYIRSVVTAKIKAELKMFIALAAAITALLMFVFFKSFRVVAFSMAVVIMGVMWSLGVIGIFQFRLTMLMGLIPPLMIVIGIPNCVFLLNKYHQEYRNHGNKIKALARVITKIGNATLMTNATTAMGFATFMFTSSDILKEFGVVASISILSVFLLSICLIPILFSFLPEPKERHVEHLDRKWLSKVGDFLVFLVQKRRKTVYWSVVGILIFGFFGISKIETTGNLVDDLPASDPIIQDLRFFESKLDGVLPLEIVIDTHRKNAATKTSTLKLVEKLQKLLDDQPEIGRPLSIVDAIKFAKQSFYNGLPSKFSLWTNNEKRFMGPYLNSGSGNLGASFLDDDRQKIRITTQMADVGTQEMDALFARLRPEIDAIFNPEEFDVLMTGTSVVFLEGTNYLVKNLFTSLAIAMVVIALLMAVLFNSFRMVLISFIPNLLPLITTAAIMGFFGIPIKPSTILVFSIAFGISVDDTIHFLAKYRQELKHSKWKIKESAIRAVRETGVSMVYTSIVLFFGFGIFAASDFGGTAALGVLVSVTLLVAMFTNLVLLPSALLSLDHFITTQAFEEPLLEIMDEEEDIDLDELVLPNLKEEVEEEEDKLEML